MEQSSAENDSPATMPEHSVSDTTMSAPDQQQQPPPSAVTNGDAMSISLPIQQLNSEGLMLPGQNAFAALDPNGVALPNTNFAIPGLQIMDGAQQSQQPATNGKAISADEIALYDRQIRLWGVKAQGKIQSANVLLITMKALANEIAKNLVLAGIGSLTIVDDQIVTLPDLGAQFLLTEENVGQNRAQAAAESARKLNPRVKIFADPESIMTKGASYFSVFDIIIATDLNPTTLTFLNTATRLHKRKFYAAASHGYYGYIFSDLIEHDYMLQREVGNMPTKVGVETRTRSVIDVKTEQEGGKTIERVTKRELYSTWDLASDASRLPDEYYKSSKRRLKAVTPALSCLRALWNFQTAQLRDPEKISRQDLEFFTKSATHHHQQLGLPIETLKSEFLRSFLQNVGCEIAPVTALLGGQLAQDIINVLGQNQPPIQNMVVFDSNQMSADVYPLHPTVALGHAQLDSTKVDVIAADATYQAPAPDPTMFNQYSEIPNPAI